MILFIIFSSYAADFLYYKSAQIICDAFGIQINLTLLPLTEMMIESFK